MSDIKIAREASIAPIQEIGAHLGIPINNLLPFGHARTEILEAFICVEIMTIPGLPRVPAAESIRINDEGRINGLF